MNCPDVLPAIATGGPLRRRRALRHAARCAACAADVSAHRELARQLAVAPPLTADQRRQWLRAATATAGRRRETPPESARGIPGRFGWRLAAVAAVAGSATVIWIVAAHRATPAPPRPNVVDRGQSPPTAPPSPPPPSSAGPVTPVPVLPADPAGEWARLSGGLDALDADLTRLRLKAERAEARRQVAAVLQQHGW